MPFDYSDFERYYNNFSKMSAKFSTWLHRYLMNEGLRLIADIKDITPVDSGDLRDHWSIQGITGGMGSLVLTFVNTMSYATEVEYGHATPYNAGAAEGSAQWVTGHFMMTISVDRLQREMPARFDRELRTFLASLGVL